MSEENILKKSNEDESNEVLKTFDMYHFFSRKDVILALVFIIALLIFSMAILLYPQVA
ncbi:MAG: hypothetical protein KTR28_06995 [Micavibrio sp.]|nr:hypothetical protein [Micavibrio sp.]